MKISTPSNFSQIKSASDFMRYVSDWVSQATKAINGKLEFDTNLLTQTVQVIFAQANADVLVSHRLNKTGVLYFPVSKNVSCDVYTGGSAATTSGIYLRSTVSNSVVTVVLF
jgi:hypothetical protein